MILKRLYELAEREGLLDDVAFESVPVPFIVNVGVNGEYLGIEERRGVITLPSRKKDAPPKTKPDKGKEILSPRAHGNTANRGFARYFVDTLARVLPVSDDPKSAASRLTFWRQVDAAAEESGDPSLKAVQRLGQALTQDPVLGDRVRARLEELKPGPGDRCTFAWQPDEGRPIVERPEVRDWYRAFYEGVAAERQAESSQGLCQITGQVGPLPRSHATKIAGIPGGIASGVSVVSNDKPAFESYNLDGAVNSGIGARAADGYTRALNALVADKLCGRKKTSLRLGPTVFLFWTREAIDADDLMQLDQPEPEQVARLIQSAEVGKASHAVDTNQFYCLCLSGNAARAIIRDYLEAPLPEVRVNLGRWFHDLQIIDGFTGEVTAVFPLWRLAASTVRSGDDVPPDIPPILMSAAIKRTAVPMHVLAACLRRIRVESDEGRFSPARMGLIKLILNRLANEGDLLMTERLDPGAGGRSPGYACGQLLALLARCQSPRDYGAGAQILERFFGAASTAPRSVFPLLLRLNRHHIRNIRDENPGFAFNLEQELEERLVPFKPSFGADPDFPAVLSLPEQGRFALGFYHQRAQYRAAAQERKAANQTSETK